MLGLLERRLLALPLHVGQGEGHHHTVLQCKMCFLKVHSEHASSDEDRFRCLAFSFLDPLIPEKGVRVGRSADATCNGVYSPEEAPWTYTFTKGLTLKPAVMCEGCSIVNSNRSYSFRNH